MRKLRFTLIAVLIFTSALGLAVRGAIFDRSGFWPTVLQAAQAPVAPGVSVFEAKTRLVIVDAVATDSHGNVVSDLKAEEFEILGGGKQPQKIAHFEFIDRSKQTTPARAVTPPGARVYSNQVAFERLRVPPTVLLMDGLNTHPSGQLHARQKMLKVLKTIPPETPVAVLLLGQSLRIVEGLTDDPTALRAAVDKALGGPDIQVNPLDDDASMTFAGSAAPSVSAQAAAAEMVDFMKEQYATLMDIRVRQTVDALESIARFLGGYPGRKNLIWFSDAFPFSLEPDIDNGTFQGSRIYSEEVRAAAEALSAAQVAVYPVGAEGLASTQVFTASTGVASGLPGPGMQMRAQREQNTRILSQGTMEGIAQATGGRPCKNTNNLAECATKALMDSSSYYEVGFYPESVNWDGSFHPIHLKTTRHGARLDYRRGYFAVGAETAAAGQEPNARLQQACTDLLPSTAIPMTARQDSLGSRSSIPGRLQYSLLVSPAVSSSPVSSEPGAPHLLLAMCEFNEKGKGHYHSARAIGNSLAQVETSESHQVQGDVDIAPQSDTRRVRFVVLDARSGSIGSLDVAVQPGDLSTSSTSSAPPATTPAPAPAKPATAPPSATSLTFRSEAGQAGVLDWTGDQVYYRGELAAELAAPALFNYLYGSRFHCESGALIVNSATTGLPTLHLWLTNAAGQSAHVDLKGNQPEYSGELPVDATAQLLFQHLWRACHCQQ